jgi:hypothetical protein
MAKLTRAVQKIFASDAAANEIEQIGSLRNGSPVYTTDPVVLQALAQYLGGLLDCVSSDKYIPALEDINAMYFLLTRQLAYLFQEGIPEWDSSTTYFQNSIVKNPGTTDLYISRTDDNIGHALSSTTYWLAQGGGVPLGGYVPVAIGVTGANSDAEMLARGYAKCNGTTPAAQGIVAPVITATMPNINAGAFIRGNTSAWTSGGASGGADAHTHGVGSFAGPSHTHTGPSHTHDVNIASFTSGTGTSHNHGYGTLKFEVGYIDGFGDLIMFDTNGANYYAARAQDNSHGAEGTNHVHFLMTADFNKVFYTTSPSGYTGSEASHTHAIDPPNTTSTAAGTGATGSGGTGAITGTSASASTLPVYFSAVYYMRVR